MNKAFLVARHEYVETVRTKAFWLGILAFPVIISLAIGIPMLLDKTKDVRKYAVIDQSGFLWQEIETRIYLEDVRNVILASRDKRKKGGEAFDRLPEVVRRLTLAWMALGEDSQDAFVSRLGGQRSGSATRAGQEALWDPETDAAEFLASGNGDQLFAWWRDTPIDDMSDLDIDLARRRFLVVEVPEERRSAEELNRMVADEQLFAYFVIGQDPVAGSEGSKYVSNNLTDRKLVNWLRGLASGVVREHRIASESIDASVARWIQEPLRFEARKVGDEGTEEEVEAEDTARQWAPTAFTYLLWISIFTGAQMLLTSTIEEKSARIMEVLVSSVSHFELMAGKVAGVAAAGLTVVGSWAVFIFLAVIAVPILVGAPSLGFIGQIIADPGFLLAFMVYFVLGYLLYASLLVGVGSVCTSIKDAQGLMMPIMIPMMIPIFAMVPVSQDPNGLFARVMSFIPPFTPFVMMNRAAGPPELWEYVATTLLLIGAIYLTMVGAARVFRIGILMTGKPPKLMEIIRWLRIDPAVNPSTMEEDS
jgi:ABC-2 type transport system permease protein